MKRIYVIIRNALLFYFLVSIYSGVQIYGGSIGGNILISLLFGLLMALVPIILGFFKISINLSSRFLMSAIISFGFFFLMYTSILPFGSLGSSVLDLGIGSFGVVKLDPLGTLITISLAMAVLSTLLHWMSGENRNW